MSLSVSEHLNVSISCQFYLLYVCCGLLSHEWSKYTVCNNDNKSSESPSM